MSVITFPNNVWVTRMRWEQMRMDLSHTSPQTGVSQSVVYGLPRWKVSLEIDRMNEDDTGTIKALLMKLRGQINQLALWDVGRPRPLGTISGSLQFGSAGSLGDTSIAITGGTNGQTFKAGDWIGVGSDQTRQLVMVTDDATVISGTVTVNIEPPLRGNHALAAPIVIEKPTALFRIANTAQGWDYEGQFVTGFTLDLIEDWQA